MVLQASPPVTSRAAWRSPRTATAVYVVNYESSTVSKLRTSDLKEIGTVATDQHPIGITYEPTTGSVWVACYGGSILVFDDSARA